MKKIIMAMIVSGAVACAAPEKKEESFQWQIDRFDDVKVLRYRVPGFEQLSADQKLLVYYLGEAAKCGRDIIYDQNFKYNLPIRRTLEAIYRDYPGDRTTAGFAAFEKYLKKVWFANGIHHHYSNDKFTPEFTPEYFDSLVAATPADLPGLEVIKPIIFDPELYPKRTSLEAGVDLLAASANNYYSGVTQAEAEAFYTAAADPADSEPVSYGLNSQLAKQDGKLVERVWKVGGMYSAAIEKIVFWLEKAAGAAENEVQRKTINTLVEYYRSGDLKTFDEYNIVWLRDTVSRVDFVNGFIETYGDALGYKASWESVVNFKNIEATRRTETISENAQWFEDNSPIDDAFKKEKVKGVSAKVITVATLGGDCFPPTSIGINLPNSDWIRRDYGSKSVTIENITDAYVQAAKGDGFAEEFVLRKEDRERMERYGAQADNLHTDLHECLGHGSGRLAEGVNGGELKNYASVLEEARADLFALYYMMDEKMVELGLLPSLDAAEAEYSKYMMNGMMTQLVRIQPGKNVEEAHMRNRMVIAQWCYERGRADNVIEKVVRDGKTYIVVNDYTRLRALLAELLREVQRIKSEGDFESGKALVETYGVKVDPELHAEVLTRYAALDLAPYSGFVNPTLTLDGNNVTISYTRGYVEQMLEYSDKYSFLD